MSVRVGIYARLSRNREGESTSIARQIAACRGRFEPEWQEVEIYEDDDLSAYSGKVRPAFERMLADIESGRIEVVVALALDRLGRQPKDIERLLGTGGRFIAIRDGLDSATASSELLIRIMAAVAKMESDNTSARILSKHAELRTNGQWSGGRRAFGLTDDWSETVPEEVAVILEAADRILAGEGLAGIATDWQERGVVTRGGKVWDTSSIKRMLLSPRMIGKRRVGAELSIEAGIPAVLDDETWRRVAAILTNPARRMSHSNAVKYLLAGFLTCGRCGSQLHTHTKGSQRRYQCIGLRGGCGKVSINAVPAEERVVTEWFRFTRSDEFKRYTAEREAQRQDRSRDTNALKGALRADRGMLNALMDRFTAGELTLPEWERARKTIDARIRESEERLADDADDPPWLAAQGLVPTVWDMAPLEDRRRLLGSMIEKIVIQPAVARGRRFDGGRINIAFTAPRLHSGDLVKIKWLQ
jgi:site-specific DNA recombinase